MLRGARAFVPSSLPSTTAPVSSSENADALIAPAYLVAFLLVATPAMDFVTSIVPMRLGDIEWRFASVGLLSGFLLTPLLGIMAAMWVAAIAGHGTLQRAIAIANMVVGGLFALLLVFFLLDVLQLRGVVQPEAKSAFESAASKAVVKHATFVFTMLYLGWRGLRVAKATVKEAPRARASVVIGG